MKTSILKVSSLKRLIKINKARSHYKIYLKVVSVSHFPIDWKHNRTHAGVPLCQTRITYMEILISTFLYM